MVTIEKGSPSTHKVGSPSTRENWTERECCPFTEVTHTTHVVPASEVIRTERINAGLVYDDSLLRNHRIAVVWMSPNDWYHGSRYGNVQITFDFAELVKDRNYYWVEIANYSPPAPRILITPKDRTGHVALNPYDPSKPEGPWWFDGERHYRNSTVCIEFMIEEDLPTPSCVRFTDHHAERCAAHRTKPQRCKELGLDAQSGASRFLARVVAEGIGSEELKFGELGLAWWCDPLLREIVRVEGEATGPVREANETADPIARAMFAAHAAYLDDDLRKLAAMFVNRDQCWTACERVLASGLGRTVQEITLEL